MKGHIAFFAAATVLLVSTPAEGSAQRRGSFRLPSRPAGQQATTPEQPNALPPAPPAPTPIVVVVPGQAGSLLNPVYRVPIVVVPAARLFDGSIFANFGFGYEPIFASCGGTARMGAVVAANGVVLDPAPAPNYTLAPSQLTRTHLLQTGLPVYDVVVSDYGRVACYRRDTDMVYVYR